MTPLLLLAKLVGVRRLTRATVAIVKWTLLLLLVGGMVFYFWLTADLDKAVIAVAALAVALGVRWWWRNRHVGIVKWAVRLLLLGLAGWVALNTDIGFGIGRILLYSAGGRITLAALAGALVFVWWRRNRRVETSVGERFIDGKPVPDKLAVAALGLPPQSPDTYDVLRGLPDYAKTLLNLAGQQFDYRPEEPMVQRAPRPKAVSPLRVAWVHAKIWLATAPRWAKVAGTAALLLAVGVFGMMISNTRQAAGEQQRPRTLTDTQTRRAEEILKNGPASAVPEASRPSIASLEAQTGGIQAPVYQPPETHVDGFDMAAAAARGAAAQGTWRDPATGLLWQMKDNGSEVITFPAAKGHCDSLDVNGLKDWRLPTFKELDTVVDLSSGVTVFRGGIQLSQPIEALWSSTPFGKRAGMYTVLATWKELPKGSTVDDFTHVLCVHD